MPDPHYPWQRYWCARGGTIPLDNVGFLADPEEKWGRFVAPGLHPLQDLVNRGALVLLGEPGLGKSAALATAAELRRHDTSAVAITPNLQAINSAQQLQQLFASPAISGWAEATNTLHLYLDAVDECRLRVDVFGELLVELLGKLPLDRLRLYLACRTTEWPLTLEAHLGALLSARGQRLEAYELAPLRRRDVEVAAAAHQLDPTTVLEAIESRGAVPLALKPVTLRLLLSTFMDGAFPDSQLGLYAAGMRALVTESQHRRETQLPGKLDIAERLAIAQRIAAITTLTGRAIIDPTGPPTQSTNSVVATWEIAEGQEHVRGRELPVTEAAVAEALDTGLFSLRGERQVGWAHQTYAEYLTAEYVRTRNLAVTQVTSLLRSTDGRVIPQLHGVAAWIAAVAPVHFEAIAASDPEILVASDVVLPSDVQKRGLVDQLLRRAAEGLRLDVLLARKLRKLAHPELREQLAPYLRRHQGTYEQRDLALDLAIFSGEESLLTDACALALDEAAPLDLRHTAALGVITFGTSALRAQLKPLIEAATGDPEERLNWLGIYAAWPTELTPDELFVALAARRRRSRLQTYSVFPVDEIAAGFTRVTLPRGLAWAARRDARLGTTDRTQRRDNVTDDLVDALLMRAWQFCDEDTTIAAGFERVVWNRFRRYNPMVGSLHGQEFAERVRAEVPRRHALVARLFRRCTTTEDVNRILLSDPRLLTTDDLPWITQQLAVATREHERIAYATALARLADVYRPDDFRCVDAALNLSPIVREQFGWVREVVELRSARADELRRTHAAAETARRRQDAARRHAPSREALRGALDKVTAEAPAAWWEFTRLLTLSDASGFPDEYERDLTALPGWATLDADDRAHALAAAETYVLHAGPDPDVWLGQPVFHRPAAAGAKALMLLAKLAPERFAQIPLSVWESWAVAILGVWTNTSEIALLREAYSHAPDAILRTVDALIAAEDRRHGDPLVVRKLGPIWDDRIAARLFAHLTIETLNENARIRLLEALLERRYAPALAFAEHALSPLPIPDAPRRAWAQTIALLLLKHVPDLTWTSLWTALTNDAFGREVLAAVAHEDRFRGAVLARLTDEQLGALFTLVAQCFPSRTDPRHASGEAFAPTLRDDVATWRSMLLTTLIHRGTTTAVSAIRAALAALPEESYLIPVLREAEAKRRQREWRPIAIPELLALAARKDLRFVESAAQLAEVVIEALDRLARLLHGETPLVGFLWNEMRVQRQLRRRPKTETQLSDFIKSIPRPRPPTARCRYQSGGADSPRAWPRNGRDHGYPR